MSEAVKCPPILFVDVEGPLIPMRAWRHDRRVRRNLIEERPRSVPYMFDPVAVEVILDLVDRAGVKLVLSSSWKTAKGFQRCMKDFRANGIGGGVFHASWRTVDSNEPGAAGRAAGILAWVLRFRPPRWAAIDDAYMPDLGRHLVHCSHEDGLLYAHQRQLLDLFGLSEGVEAAVEGAAG